MQIDDFNKRKKKIPDTPGVYFFLDGRKKILYIGKATSLHDRIRSYFAKALHETRGPVLVKMLERAKSIDWRQTDSVLEALILEANLVRTYKPAHNTDLKDDKSWNYVVITKEDFPRVLLVRGRELDALRKSKFSRVRDFSAEKSLRSSASLRSLSQTSFAPLHTFGPFPHGLQLKEALRIIRKIFPFRDTCVPPPAGGSGKPCFNRSLGLCPGVCSGEISKIEYRKIVRRIVLLFQGKKTQLIKSLERDMKKLAKEERFEEAALLRRQVFALTHIHDVSLIKDEYRSTALAENRKGLSNTRIEAYDVAHLQGSSNVGVMTVVEDGETNKNEYRKFRIRLAKPGDDVGALREILFRRLAHEEWRLPRIIAVDGSKAQINAAEAVVKEYGMGIPVVGVVKDDKHRPRGILGDRALINGRERDILLANSEAHRFTIQYHRKRSRADSLYRPQ